MTDEDQDQEDQRVPEDQIDWRQWPIAGVVAKRLGISKRELAQMVNDREIVRYRAKDGTWRFDPKDVEAIIRSARIGQRDITAAELDPVVVSGDRAQRGPEVAAMASLFAAQGKIIDQLQAHIEKLADLAVRPANKALEVLETTCGRLSAQNESLSEKLRNQTVAAEAASSDAFYRDIAARELSAAEKRKSDIADLILKKAGPVLFAKWAGVPVDGASLLGRPAGAPQPPKPTNGHSGPSTEQTSAAIELLISLQKTPELFAGLQEIDGIFDARQRELIRVITGSTAKTDDTAGTPTTNEATSCEKVHTDA